MPALGGKTFRIFVQARVLHRYRQLSGQGTKQRLLVFGQLPATLGVYRQQADRLLVNPSLEPGERKSRGGILIPATAAQSRRLVWAEVVAVGPNVRNLADGDRVLFSPEAGYEVEIRGEEYIILRERDIHAVASTREDGNTGLYL